MEDGIWQMADGRGNRGWKMEHGCQGLQSGRRRTMEILPWAQTLHFVPEARWRIYYILYIIYYILYIIYYYILYIGYYILYVIYYILPGLVSAGVVRQADKQASNLLSWQARLDNI